MQVILYLFIFITFFCFRVRRIFELHCILNNIFIIFVILSVAMCKAINMLKISLQDGADDTVPVPAEQLPNQQRATGPPEMGTQSVASGYLLNGKWNCNVS